MHSPWMDAYAWYQNVLSENIHVFSNTNSNQVVILTSVLKNLAPPLPQITLFHHNGRTWCNTDWLSKESKYQQWGSCLRPFLPSISFIVSFFFFFFFCFFQVFLFPYYFHLFFHSIYLFACFIHFPSFILFPSFVHSFRFISFFSNIPSIFFLSFFYSILCFISFLVCFIHLFLLLFFSPFIYSFISSFLLSFLCLLLSFFIIFFVTFFFFLPTFIVSFPYLFLPYTDLSHHYPWYQGFSSNCTETKLMNIKKKK